MSKNKESAPPFFIPSSEPKEFESLYAAFANLASGFMGWRVAPLPLGQRIYSVDFTHDGEHFTATVGATLQGDRALVLAIFPGGSTHIVVTDAFGDMASASGWNNPFMTGPVRRVIRFSEPQGRKPVPTIQGCEVLHLGDHREDKTFPHVAIVELPDPSEGAHTHAVVPIQTPTITDDMTTGNWVNCESYEDAKVEYLRRTGSDPV